jgi:hypothetical protein
MLVCRLDLPNGLSLAVDRIADRRVAFIKQRWKAGPYRGSSAAAAGQDTLHGTQLQLSGQCRELSAHVFLTRLRTLPMHTWLRFVAALAMGMLVPVSCFGVVVDD